MIFMIGSLCGKYLCDMHKNTMKLNYRMSDDASENAGYY